MPPPRSSEEIVAEIRERFGFLPPFFAPALSSPALLENLWQQTLSAYVENPLPALFKEKLFAHLSRYCVVPYCLVCHSCALRPLGMTPAEVLATIERPAPVDESELSQLDAALAAAAPLTDWPAPGTPLDDILHRASMMVFLDLGPAARYRAELRRLLADSYDQLVVFLAYVKTCFTWVEAHPELSWEADRRAQEHLSPLLADEPSLAVFFERYQGIVARERARGQERRADLERARMGNALRESEERFRKIFEEGPLGMALVASDGHLLRVNTALCRMLSCSDQDLVARSIADIVHPEDRATLVGAIEGVFARALAPCTVEKRFATEGRGTIRGQVTASAIRDERGDFLYGLLMIEDITERRALEDQLRQAQKLEAVGRLAGGVAHDFNNLLTIITGRSALLLAKLRDPAAARDIGVVHEAAERAAALTNQLLAFSRSQTLLPKMLDLNAVVGTMGTMLQRLIGEDVELVIATAADPGRIDADRGQIEQVIMNLAVNARDAMPSGGRLVIATAEAEVESGDVVDPLGVPPGAYVVLKVTDTGAGMDVETQRRMFEPFFTTKDVGQGTGLGLSTVYGIVRQSGGAVAVDSAPGRGTTFTIYLPKSDAGLEVEGAAPLPEVGRGSEVVLLVEDEVKLRGLEREILEDHGYTVLEARDVDEAERIAADHPGPIHLLITDVVMPKLSGSQLAERLLPRRPAMKILYMSGYAESIVAAQAESRRPLQFLQKPFSPDALARKVRAVLDAST